MGDDEIFIDLTETNFKSEVLDTEQIVLVKFVADWLATCSIMAPILEKLSLSFRDRIKFCRVDVDRNKVLVDTYNVTYLPTYIFFRGRQVVDKIVGTAPGYVFSTKMELLLEQDNKP